MNIGDDVTVKFQGRKHDGEIVSHHHGWVMCRIHIDPAWDYGSITSRLDPVTTVMVREQDVKPRD